MPLPDVLAATRSHEKWTGASPVLAIGDARIEHGVRADLAALAAGKPR